MLIINARDNENNRWKRKAKEQGQWELNGFAVRFRVCQVKM